MAVQWLHRMVTVSGFVLLCGVWSSSVERCNNLAKGGERYPTIIIIVIFIIIIIIIVIIITGGRPSP